jgi:peptide/nickel transport system substrate-binding protein
VSEQKRPLTRREFLKYAGTAAAGSILAACAPVPAPQVVEEPVTQEAEKVAAPTPTVVKPSSEPIVMGVANDPEGFNGCMSLSDHPQYFVERKLVEYDYKMGTFDVVPGTAESWEILDDGLRYRMHIRENVKFHDGTEFNAEAMKFWLEMMINEDHPYHGVTDTWRCGVRVQGIQEFQVVDNFTLDLVLPKVNPPQLVWMGTAAYACISPTAVKSGADVIQGAYGLGPYKIAQHDKGLRAVMERFDQFYDPQVGKAPQIILRPIPETASLIASLEAGEIHWMEGIPPEEVQRLREVAGITVAERKTLYVWFIHLDMRKSPLDDVRVRQALNYAIDKESLIQNVLSGAGERSYSPLSPQFGDFYAGDVVHHYDYDPQKAKDLLAEAGFPNGFDEIDGQRATLYTNTGRVGQQKPVEMCEFIQAQWKEIGVDVEIEAMEWATFEGRRTKGEFPMATRGWTPSDPSPDGVLLQNFHGDYHPPAARAVAYLDDPDVNRLLDEGGSTADHATRVEKFVEAQKRIVDLAPWVFIDHEIAFEAYTDRLQDYVVWSGGRGAGLLYATLKA